MATLIARLDPNMAKSTRFDVERSLQHTVLWFPPQRHFRLVCQHGAAAVLTILPPHQHSCHQHHAALGRRNSCAYLGPQQVFG